MRAFALPILVAVVMVSLNLPAGAAGEGVTGLVFDALERQTIRDYFGDQARAPIDTDRDVDADGDGSGKKKGKKGKKDGLPPGLAKKDELPPGLQKQLEKNGTLPPGLEKRRLPRDLERRLKRRWDEEAVIVDDDVLLVKKATGVIIDIIRDVVR